MKKLPQYCCAIISLPSVSDDDGVIVRILMEQRPDDATFAAGRLCCFGGAREKNESPLACIQRELHEELAWCITDTDTDSDTDNILTHVHTLSDGDRCIAWFYHCTLNIPLSATHCEAGHSAVSVDLRQRHRFPISDWHRLVLDNYINNIAHSDLDSYHYGKYLRSQSDTNPPWQVTSSRSVYTNQWSEVIEDQLIGPQQQKGVYGYFAHKDSVVICPVFANGDILLVRQWRHAAQAHTWELPCGCIEAGEDPLHSAQRELAEECDLYAPDSSPTAGNDNWHPHGDLFHSDARVRGRVHFFLATNVAFLDPCAHNSTQNSIHKDDSESDMCSIRVPFSEALSAVEHGDIDTMLSAYFILRLKEYLHTQGQIT